MADDAVSAVGFLQPSRSDYEGSSFTDAYRYGNAGSVPLAGYR
ncbi:MAG: hypothetical protein QOH41_3970 [Blastocatellia bacterium]|jgi:hypothetical protein|nr:hypothetical protein [Blastocatellia bacterium]